jgi:integrase
VTLRAVHSGMVKSKMVKTDQKLIQEKKDNGYVFPPALEHKIENIIDGLRQGFLKLLHDISPENATIIVEYILAMKTEINLSDHYRQDNIIALCELSKYFDNKPFKSITNRDIIIAFLDRFRKSESLDPLHKWIGTYNTYRIYLLRFFKWLYYPNIESDKRPKPEVVQNIPMLKRKEKSVYKPTDLWTVEDDLLFLKYCPSKRMKCYHAVTRDTACRPHEILKLRIKDVQFKTAINGQYAEVFVNGKTGTRHLPLIDSIPFVKDYLDHEHPQPTNPEAAFIAGTKKSLTKKLQPASIHKIYENFKKDYFPKLLESTTVPLKDKQKIKDLLKKPWNPYIRRHSALTIKVGDKVMIEIKKVDNSEVQKFR